MEHPQKLHRPTKRLGQNFLADPDVASRIVSLASLTRKDVVLEPGAGSGNLTRHLREKAGRVIAVEKDHYLASKLRELFRNDSSVEIKEADVLKTDLPAFSKVVGTPPYYISSRLLLLLSRLHFERACLVYQREFAERISAQAGTSDYGRLSVMSQRYFHISLLMSVPRTAFKPVPKVDSVLVSLIPKQLSKDIDSGDFEELVRGIFSQRRRLVRGALLHHLELKFGRNNALEIMRRLSPRDLRVYQLSVHELEALCQEVTTTLRLLSMGEK